MTSQKWCNRWCNHNFERLYLKNEMSYTGKTCVIWISSLCTTYLSLILGRTSPLRQWSYLWTTNIKHKPNGPYSQWHLRGTVDEIIWQSGAKCSIFTSPSWQFCTSSPRFWPGNWKIIFFLRFPGLFSGKCTPEWRMWIRAIAGIKHHQFVHAM